MMVESLHAHVAVVAMSGPGRPVDVAGVAEFHLLGVGFDCAGVENRLLLADGPVDVGLADGDPPECRLLEVAEDLGDDAGVHPGQHQHEHHGADVEESSQHYEVPVLGMGGECVHESHAHIDDCHSAEIVLRFRYHEAESLLIAIIWNLGHLVRLVLRHPQLLFRVCASQLLGVASL